MQELMQRSCTYLVSKVIEVSLWYGVSHGLPTKRGCVCSHHPCWLFTSHHLHPSGTLHTHSFDGLETIWL